MTVIDYATLKAQALLRTRLARFLQLSAQD
jgi:hypothetical protein